MESFVVRITLDNAAGSRETRAWRGHITHVADGRRRHFQQLEAIPIFIASYLVPRGVRISPEWRVRGWFDRWQRPRG